MSFLDKRFGKSQWMALAVVTALTAGACGSTAERGSLGSDRGLGELSEDSALGSEGSERSAGEPGVSGPSGPVSPNSTEAPGAASPGSVPGSTASGRPPIGPGVHGVTDKVIQVGIDTWDEAQMGATVSALSGANYAPAEENPDNINAALVDYINATGGMAGRKIQPIYYRSNVGRCGTTASCDQMKQEMCSHWTEDNHVFAIAAVHHIDSEFWLDCAQRTKTPIVLGVPGYHPWPTESRFDAVAPYWYLPISFQAKRRERAFGRFLDEHGFFSKSAKVGVLIQNTPGIREGIEKGLKPVLRAEGINLAVEIVYPDPSTSQWDNYVLQMKQKNVTHIIFSASTGSFFPPLLMMRAAENQLYRPKWGIGSDQDPALIQTLGAPREQLANTVGMGWRPRSDISSTKHQSSSGTTCANAMKKVGTPAGGYAMLKCEQLFFLRAALDRAVVVSPEGMAAGTARLGDSHKSIEMLGGASRFGPRRHDGVTIARYFSWDRECTEAHCFKYTSGPERISD